MPRPELRPEYLDVEECKIIASRHVLSSITLPANDPKPSIDDALFSLDELPAAAFGGDALFNWKSRDIYDVDGLLLFREMSLELVSGDEVHVAVAASDLLQTPVSCECRDGGEGLRVEEKIARALVKLEDDPDWEPLIEEGEKDVRLVSYNYPSLGIQARSRTNHAPRAVITLDELTVIPIDPYTIHENPESVTAIWSPYDTAVRSRNAHSRQLWEQNVNSLPALPATPEELPDKIIEFRRSFLDGKVIRLNLIPQQTASFCAAATAQMILDYHRLNNKPQDVIAGAMQTGPSGAAPELQVDGINRLFGTSVRAELDRTPSFEEVRTEILANRPFKTGGPYHARAVCGYRVEEGDKRWLFIFDPEPANQGRVCRCAWNEGSHHNFMYVRPLRPRG
jgi:hypothetical protein